MVFIISRCCVSAISFTFTHLGYSLMNVVRGSYWQEIWILFCCVAGSIYLSHRSFALWWNRGSVITHTHTHTQSWIDVLVLVLPVWSLHVLPVFVSISLNVNVNVTWLPLWQITNCGGCSVDTPLWVREGLKTADEIKKRGWFFFIYFLVLWKIPLKDQDQHLVESSLYRLTSLPLWLSANLFLLKIYPG